MNVATRITVDSHKVNDALGRFCRDRAMLIGGREVKGGGAIAVGGGRSVRAGTIPVDTYMDGTLELPGYRQSGVGRELGRNAVKDYTEEKTFHVHTGPRRSWWLPRGARRN
jgi:hypothetical protein